MASVKFDECKKYFTIEEYERCKQHAKEGFEKGELLSLITLFAGSRKLLNYELTWAINRPHPERTYFGDGIDINCEIWTFDPVEGVRKTWCSLWEICQISPEFTRDDCGYQTVFKEVK